MKTKFMIPAMLVLSMVFSPLFVTSTHAAESSIDIEVAEKTKLDVTNLPEVLRNGIANDGITAELKVKEAWLIEEEGVVHYKVIFDMDGEDYIRKYDANGKLIEDYTI